jgi:hypothetical protein
MAPHWLVCHYLAGAHRRKPLQGGEYAILNVTRRVRRASM